jgi:hypothetical protein
MFDVKNADGTKYLVSRISSEYAALWRAVDHVTRQGEDALVVGGGTQLWYVEADTKVDDYDPTFPAIVHRRSR